MEENKHGNTITIGLFTRHLITCLYLPCHIKRTIMKLFCKLNSGSTKFGTSIVVLNFLKIKWKCRHKHH